MLNAAEQDEPEEPDAAEILRMRLAAEFRRILIRLRMDPTISLESRRDLHRFLLRHLRIRRRIEPF